MGLRALLRIDTRGLLGADKTLAARVGDGAIAARPAMLHRCTGRDRLAEQNLIAAMR